MMEELMWGNCWVRMSCWVRPGQTSELPGPGEERLELAWLPLPPLESEVSERMRFWLETVCRPLGSSENLVED